MQKVADMNNLLRLFAAILVVLSCIGSPRAEEGSILDYLSSLNQRKEPLDFAIATGFESRHMARKENFNESNRGFGLRFDGGWVVGAYYNSIWRYSIYAGREYQWHVAGPDSFKLNAGVVLGGVSGYEDGIQLGGVQHGIHLAVLPELVLAMRYAEAALIYIPSAAKTPATLAAQLRFKF